MARGFNSDLNSGAATRRDGKTIIEEKRVSIDNLLAVDNDPLAAGEVVEIEGVGSLVNDEDTPALTASGIADVKKVTRRGAGLYRVVFTDGEQALVSLGDGSISVAHSLDPEAPQAQINGAIAAALAFDARFAGEASPTDTQVALADAQHDFEINPTPESLAAYAAAAQKAMAESADEVVLADSELHRQLSQGRPDRPLSPRAQARAQAEAWRQGFARRTANMPRSQAAMALLHAVDEDTGQLVGIDENEFADRARQAEELGVNVPDLKIAFNENGESIGAFEVGVQEEEFFDLIRSREQVGQRTIIMRGDPGTGKSEMAEQIAAIHGMGLVKINVGPGFNIEDAIGGDGLTSEAIKDEDGNVIGAATVSTQLEGPLTRAVQRKSVVVIEEPEGMENEMVRLHSVAGDKVGDPTQRYVIVNAAAGEMRIPVHPDCRLIFTYNSGEEDVRFKTALHDRALNLDFEYPTQEQEANRYARMTSEMLTHQVIAPNIRPKKEEVTSDDGELLDIKWENEITPAQVLPVVRAMEKLRNVHKAHPEDFVDQPGARQGAHIFTDLYLGGWLAYDASQEDPYEPVRSVQKTVQKSLRYVLPGSAQMNESQRDTMLDEVLADEIDELHEIAMAGARAREEFEKGAN